MADVKRAGPGPAAAPNSLFKAENPHCKAADRHDRATRIYPGGALAWKGKEKGLGLRLGLIPS